MHSKNTSIAQETLQAIVRELPAGFTVPGPNFLDSSWFHLVALEVRWIPETVLGDGLAPSLSTSRGLVRFLILFVVAGGETPPCDGQSEGPTHIALCLPGGPASTSCPTGSSVFSFLTSPLASSMAP